MSSRSRSYGYRSSLSDSRCICDKLFENLQLLVQFIDIPNLSPHLLSLKIMNQDEYSQLRQMWSERRMQEAVIQLLLCLNHKPDWGRKLLTALEESIGQRNTGLVHLGHVSILKELRERGEEFQRRLEQVIPTELEALLESVDACSNNSQLGLLNIHLPLLIHYTDITIVLPFLKVKGLLTDEDYLQLKKLWCANERRDAVEMLLFTMSRKCPEWELCFVDALYQSLHSEYGDYHDGHRQILDTLHRYGVTFEQEGLLQQDAQARCTCNCHEYVAPAEPAVIFQRTPRVAHTVSQEFQQSATHAIQQLYKHIENCLQSLESSQSVQVSYLKDISTHLDTLSSLCSSMMNKCQHRRIQQGMQTSLSQLKIGAAAFECQVERQVKRYSGDLRTRDKSTECHVIKPRWIDYKDLKDMMHNLEDYVTELLEWTDTAFATVYPHDDMVLIKEWGAR